MLSVNLRDSRHSNEKGTFFFFPPVRAKGAVVEKKIFCGPSQIFKYVDPGPREGQKLQMMGWSFQLHLRNLKSCSSCHGLKANLHLFSLYLWRENKNLIFPNN